MKAQNFIKEHEEIEQDEKLNAFKIMDNRAMGLTNRAVAYLQRYENQVSMLADCPVNAITENLKNKLSTGYCLTDSDETLLKTITTLKKLR